MKNKKTHYKKVLDGNPMLQRAKNSLKIFLKDSLHWLWCTDVSRGGLCTASVVTNNHFLFCLSSSASSFSMIIIQLTWTSHCIAKSGVNLNVPKMLGPCEKAPTYIGRNRL